MDPIFGKPPLRIIAKGIQNFAGEKINFIKKGFFVSELAVIRTDLAIVWNFAPENRLADSLGFSACPDFIQRGFLQISDFPARPDDKTTKIGISVNLNEKVFPGLRAYVIHDLRIGRIVWGKFCVQLYIHLFRFVFCLFYCFFEKFGLCVDHLIFIIKDKIFVCDSVLFEGVQ